MTRTRFAAKQLAIVGGVAAICLVITLLIFEVAGTKKTLEWSKSIGFLAFALAAWLALIAKLPEIAKIDFLPEWEQAQLTAALSRLKQQLWACFFFTLVTAAVGVSAGIFTDSNIQDEVAVLVLYLTLSAFSILGFLPVFWGRVTSAIKYIAMREKQEKDRATEVEALTKGLQTPYKPVAGFDGYTREAE